jgi:hypothetical protein
MKAMLRCVNLVRSLPVRFSPSPRLLVHPRLTIQAGASTQGGLKKRKVQGEGGGAVGYNYQELFREYCEPRREMDLTLIQSLSCVKDCSNFFLAISAVKCTKFSLQVTIISTRLTQILKPLKKLT